MDINFGTSVTNCSVIFDIEGNYGITNNSMWIHGDNWNGMVAFPNGATLVSANNSLLLNKIVKIPNSVTNMTYTFNGCTNLNQNIQIPNNVTSMYSTFNRCTNLNQNIQIPNSVTNMAYTFGSCTNLNQNIQIPNNVTSMYSTFSRCNNLNQNIQMPNGVTNAWFVFKNCNSMSDLTIRDGVANNVFVGMLSTNNTHSRNVWTGQNSAANLITTNIIHPANSNSKIAGQIRPTWETITNGYYNALYNVYIYTNAVFN